jgi:peptide/nickel transport system permease protein
MRRAWLAKYLRGRLLALVPTTLLVTFVAFSLIHISPGGPVTTLLGGHPTTAAAIAAIEKHYHLNEPFLAQYFIWLRDAIRLNFGQSITSGESVSTTILQRLPVTIVLNMAGIFLATVFGVTLGCVAALRRGRPTDRFVAAFSTVGISAPAFVTGIILLYIFGLKLGWMPVYGPGTGGLLDQAHHLILPAVTLALGVMGLVMRISRTSMIRELQQDHVLFARARGLSGVQVTTLYALRNALVPIVTAAGLLCIGILSGSVLVETVFGIPGIGSLLVTSINSGDIPVVQGLVLLFAVWIVILNILIDIVYLLLDPRIAFTRVEE